DPPTVPPRGPRVGPLAAPARRRSGRGPSLRWDVTRSRFLSLDSAGLKYLVLLRPVLRTRMGDRMSSTGKEIRLRRLFSGGKALVVAMDHGVSSGPVAGLEDIRTAVANVARVGAGLGAAVGKTVYTGSGDTFREVIRGCPVPVLVAGGPKLDSDRAALGMVEGAIAGGAAGVSIGRNVFQSKNPIGMTRAIARVLFEGASADDVYRG